MSSHGHCCGGGAHETAAPVNSCCGGSAGAAAKAIDPVCGMSVDPEAGKPRAEHAGTTYHFCSEGCRTKFVADPDHYLSGAHRKAADEAPAGTLYTCSMHPEIVQEGPGTCPICGMALEAMGIPSDEPNPERVDFTRRLKVGAPLARVLLVLDMSMHFFGWDLLPFVPPH